MNTTNTQLMLLCTVAMCDDCQFDKKTAKALQRRGLLDEQERVTESGWMAVRIFIQDAVYSLPKHYEQDVGDMYRYLHRRLPGLSDPYGYRGIREPRTHERAKQNVAMSIAVAIAGGPSPHSKRWIEVVNSLRRKELCDPETS